MREDGAAVIIMQMKLLLKRRRAAEVKTAVKPEMLRPAITANELAAIDIDKLQGLGVCCILLDIDNTVSPWGEETVTEATLRWVSDAEKRGIRVAIATNGKKARVDRIAELLGADSIKSAGKPGIKKISRYLSECGIAPENCAMIGDQLFTDVWGARRVGIFSILTRPIDKKEEIQIILKRRLEWIVLYFYKKKCRKEGTEFLVHGNGR